MDFNLFLSTVASSSSSSPPSLQLSLPRTWIHHVFPSFHGADVRRSFLKHILKEFRSKGIDTFIDNEISRGEFIGPELKKAIRGSRIAIVLFTKNYAYSSWCLDELVEIMKCKEVLGQTVIAIFYEVDPSDIKKQTGGFGKAFRKTCKGQTNEVIEKWRQALAQVATVAGYHSINWDDEAAMIENIATDISNMLNIVSLSRDFDGFVGMRNHMENMGSLLRLDLDEVRMIGIWGPPGIGKSTIARVLFNEHSLGFQLRAIMVNIRVSYPRPCLDEYSAQLQLQSQMMTQMLSHNDTVTTHLGVVRERLKDKKVFLVLDDVDRLAQLDALAKDIRWFGRGSRIIITTEDLRVLKAHGINHIYKVDFPTTDEALQIFCMYAFGQKCPIDGFEELAREVTYHSGKLPLALKVMGSHFRRMSKQEWKKELPRLRSHLDREIESVLKFSYDALYDEDKYLFLHISCFFNYENVERVVEHLSKRFLDVRQGLDILAEKSLISMKSSSIEMHSLLVKLGCDIVRKQSIDEPGQRQFLVDSGEICDVLTDDAAGSRSVIGINCDRGELNISERAFEKMTNLQFLRLSQSTFPHDTCLSYLSPKLQLLDWSYFPATCLPSNVHTKFLVELNLVYSKLEKLWGGNKSLQNLKRMNLSYSRKLKELPNLSTATSLEELNLMGCLNLGKLPSTIGSATNLQNLFLSGCYSLVEIPSSIGNATNLQNLDLEGCSSLVELPYSIGNATNLQNLDLKGCSSLVELPSSIGNATNLQNLDLEGCSSLVEIPSSIGNATNLQNLDLERCSSLVELPSSIGNATNLQKLGLKGCSSIVELPSSIGNAIMNLDDLDFSGCSNLVEIPSSIGNAINLNILIFNGCSSLVELPASIGNLHKLHTLLLRRCSKLEVLPVNINLESLDKLDLSDCLSLRSFPKISTNLTSLDLSRTAIEEVPSLIMSWSRLETLNMSYCENLKEFPHAPDSITGLDLSYTKIQEIPPLVRGFSRLRWLTLNGCKELLSLPQLPYSLEYLNAENCESLERLDCSFENPKIYLNFANCFRLNKEARDLIIQTSTQETVILSNGEIPNYFTHRANGGSLIVKLNERFFPSSLIFKACILLVSKNETGSNIYYGIKEKHNSLKVSCSPNSILLSGPPTEHLYIFEIEADVTLNDLFFEFRVRPDQGVIKGCGVHNVN